jgi:chemotaxis protein methyltransferase CheR
MAIASATFEYIRRLVLQRSAIVLEPGKEYLVDCRLVPVARANGFASVDELAAELSKCAFNSMHRQVVEAMTTNETSWFRDVHPFDALKRRVLPELIAARGIEAKLHIWCAASSSGQEPYTIAMILREYFPQLRDWKVSILATDLATAVLAKARTGRYSQAEINRGLPAPLLVKYFTKDGTEWQISDSLRAMVEFRELNLAEHWPLMPAPDLVFMRNVLIYFDVATKKEILRRVRHVIRPDGYLFLGGAETTMSLDESFEREPIDRAVVYRVAGQRATRAYAGV